MARTASFNKGFDVKRREIQEMGFESARDKLNQEVSPGQPWTGSAEGLQYARGEMEALLNACP